ncbi:hypothetical protein PWT90_11129 [Aphanocladium album]|nr:hypothetical protein PWT90_11129 [Aphanocladium album]
MPQPRHNVEPEPPHWELIEATRYFFEYVQPLIKGQALPKTVRVPAWNGSSGWSLLMRVSTHRLNATHRILGRMATEDEDPSTSGAWATYSRQMAYLLRLVNEGINGDMGCQSNKELLLRRIYNLVFHDLAVDASAWRLHMIGYLALVQQLGGVRALMQDSTHHLTLTQWGMLNMGIGYNTTSPASMQLRGFEAYTYEDIAKLANVLGTQTFRTPASLLTATQNISQLRSHEADNTYTDPAMKMAVRDVFNRIVAFDGAKWAVDMKYKEVEKITVGAHILQEAILLYAILSLPRSAVVSWSEAAGSRERSGSQTSAFGRLLTVHRRRLLDLLRPYQGSFESRLDLNWPLVVAGVSLGGDGSSVNDRGFVADSILGIWRNPITRCSPLVCLGKLRAFWESGKTAWDDCFYEPTPCLG